MSRPISFIDNSRSPPATAEAWFARLHAPDCSELDRSRFQDWLEIHPSHRTAYAECESISALSARLHAQPGVVDALLTDAGLVDHQISRSRPRWSPAIGIAAMLCAAVAIGLLFRYQASAERDFASTGRGEQRQVVLPDGSTVQLNTNTQLVVHFTDHQRQVELKQGEAFFDVAKDHGKPFVVAVGKSEVRVVGTQFSVRDDDGKLEVIVREGKVNVVPDAHRSSLGDSERVELLPGNRLTFAPSDMLIKVSSVDAERSLAWRTGSIEFDSVTLEEAVNELNRYTDQPLVIEDEQLKLLRLSGRFRVGDISGLAFALHERFDIDAVHTANRIVLRPAKQG